MDKLILTRTHDGKEIRQRWNGYLCLTDMASAYNKRANNWLKSDDTVEYLRELESVTNISNLIETVEGKGGGTWGHPKVAIRFAQWVDVRFAIQVDTWIEELLVKRTLTLPKTPEQQKWEDNKYFLEEALKWAISMDRPKTRALAEQRLAEHLEKGIGMDYVTPNTAKLYESPYEVAIRLGYAVPHALIGELNAIASKLAGGEVISNGAVSFYPAGNKKLEKAVSQVLG